MEDYTLLETLSHLRQGIWSKGLQWPLKWGYDCIYYNGVYHVFNFGFFYLECEY